MKKIYNDNGLPFYEAADIRDRDYLVQLLTDELKMALWAINPTWQFFQIEAPGLIPRQLVSKEYGAKDLYATPGFYLKPETTASSYAYAADLIEHQAAKPPLCVWQASKSFRRENDQVTANVRLKEFYQQEFQCIHTEGTHADYQDALTKLEKAVGRYTGLPTRIVPSDRLPGYSEKTLDIEVAFITSKELPKGEVEMQMDGNGRFGQVVNLETKWLEVCSSSIRNDVKFKWQDKPLKNVEFAFGLDRLLYARGRHE